MFSAGQSFHKIWNIYFLVVILGTLQTQTFDIFSFTDKRITSSPWTVTLSWLQHAYSRPLFWRAILKCKVGRIDLVFGVWLGSLAGLYMQDYKSVYSRYDLFYHG